MLHRENLKRLQQPFSYLTRDNTSKHNLITVTTAIVEIQEPRS